MLAVVVGLGAVVALVAEAVLKGVAGWLVQSLHNAGTVIDLDWAGRAETSRFLGEVRQIRA